MTKEEIGARLRTTREALGLSQADITRLTGIPANRWNNAETGDNRIGQMDAAVFCRTFGVDFDWVYRGLMTDGVSTEVRRKIAEYEAKRARKRA